MGSENRVEDVGEEGKRSLGKMLQCPIRARRLETPDGFVNLVRVG